MTFVPDWVVSLTATIIVIGTCSSWLVVEIVRLRRALREPDRTPERSDRIFGSIISSMIMIVGLVGAALFNLT
jgi:hypothetical protein